MRPRRICSSQYPWRKPGEMIHPPSWDSPLIRGSTAMCNNLTAAGVAACLAGLVPAARGEAADDRKPDGTGAVAVSGELKQWHRVTLTLDGPYAAERDVAPNPFTDYRLAVTFRHESGAPRYVVPGY